MAAPLKPWETFAAANVHHRNNPAFNNPGFQGLLNPQDPSIPSTFGSNVGVPSATRVAPPLPPRPTSGFSQYNNYSPFSSAYSSYGSMYNPYGYGSFGYNSNFGYNRFGGYPNSDLYDNSFVQVAEENSRPAFQSIESVVHTVSSVSMMLESTLNAVYSSFRAVIGVADHFSRMKMHLTHVFSMLAILRTLKWILYRLLRLLGIINYNAETEMVWEASLQPNLSTALLSENDLKQNRNWPIFLFIVLVLGTPWLVWKILSSVTQISSQASKEWALGRTDHYVAIAEYDFRGERDREISFTAGQEIRLAPKELQPRIRGWLLGSVDGVKTGLVPANYIKIMGKRSGIPSAIEQPTSQQIQDEKFLSS